ncbi:MAG TPA: Na+:solute symporter, partial [Verrucomicrobiae bacterium]
ASKSEKDSLGAVLFFNIAHYVIRPWPWILVALASLIIYPELSDIKKAFPLLDKSLLGHDIAYPAMLIFLPVGFAGLMVGGLISANSSTILTHLNWGASYLVHDFYRRFVKKDASEHHYVTVGRISTVLLFIFSSAIVFKLDTARDTFDIMLQVGAGTGLLYLVRWFWWRVNAWCEIVAMISSFAISVFFFIANKSHVLALSTHQQLLATIGFTTFCWIITAYVMPPTDVETLVSFYRKTRPAGPGWEPIRRLAGETNVAPADDIPRALLGWTAGCALIWSALFSIGNFLYGRYTAALALLAVAVVTAMILIRIVNRIWSAAPINEANTTLSAEVTRS